MIRRNLLITMITMGLLSVTYGAVDESVLFGAAMNPSQCARVVRALERLSAMEVGGFMIHLAPLIEGIEGEGRCVIIQAFGAVPAADRADMVAPAMAGFGVGMDGFHRARVIRSLVSIPAGERNNLIEMVHPLIEGIEGEGRVNVIEVLTAIPAAQRAVVAAQSAQLVEAGMDGLQRAQVIRQLVAGVITSQ